MCARSHFRVEFAVAAFDILRSLIIQSLLCQDLLIDSIIVLRVNRTSINMI